MNITLWILQVLLGGMFILSGYGKAFFSWEELQKIPWIDGVTHNLMIFIGWSEVLGGIGVILPAALKIKPILTPVAATGLLVIMILALGFHLMRGEYYLIPYNLISGAVAGFVAYGRFKLSPIQ